MGAHAYWYFVDYNPNIDEALQQLRNREFNAGRYNPAKPFPCFPIGPQCPTSVVKHGSIEEAIEDSGTEGTRSILDILAIDEEPGFCTAAPLSDDSLDSLYDTTQPTRQMIEQNMGFLDDIERGHCIYIVVYQDGKPSEIFFGGFSFD
jgi:hypothetical protein